MCKSVNFDPNHTKKYLNNVKFTKNDEWRLKSVKFRITDCTLENCLKTLE